MNGQDLTMVNPASQTAYRTNSMKNNSIQRLLHKGVTANFMFFCVAWVTDTVLDLDHNFPEPQRRLNAAFLT